MALHPPAGRGEAELLAVPVANPEIEPGLAQPLDRQVFEDVAEGEDAQRLAGELGARVLRRLQVLVLQAPAAALAEAAAAEVVALRPRRALGDERLVDEDVDLVDEGRRLLAVIEVEGAIHQNGTSGSGRARAQRHRLEEAVDCGLRECAGLRLAQLVEAGGPADLGHELGHQPEARGDRRPLAVVGINHLPRPRGGSAGRFAMVGELQLLSSHTGRPSEVSERIKTRTTGLDAR